MYTCIGSILNMCPPPKTPYTLCWCSGTFGFTLGGTEYMSSPCCGTLTGNLNMLMGTYVRLHIFFFLKNMCPPPCPIHCAEVAGAATLGLTLDGTT